MAKKKLFWERRKEYYRFPLWMRMVKGVLTVGFTAVKLALGAVLIALSVVLITGVVFACYLGDYLQEDVIPNADYTLENIDLDQTSFIYYVDQNNQVVKLQQIYTSIDRVWVPYDEIPQDLVHAAVAIEDKRFFQHQGVDWVTTVKACANMFLGSRSTFGGSTITQQLIKNLTDEDDVTVRRKVQEIFRALRFEEHYDKEVVMEWYLNTIYLGENCYGVQTAARTYFGKDVKDLTAAETRRVDLSFRVDPATPLEQVEGVIAEVLAANPNVLDDPAPSVVLTDITDSAIVYGVRIWCVGAKYWDTRFALNRAVKLAFDRNGIVTPHQQVDVHLNQPGS